MSHGLGQIPWINDVSNKIQIWALGCGVGWILERRDGVMWTGLVWLRIGTGGELL
jgi:hypothetical protein